ncbi:MAG: CrcB family protein [Alistipes putredinis]|nr:MAG: CrcB family protein [Alistipes putredinis]
MIIAGLGGFIGTCLRFSDGQESVPCDFPLGISVGHFRCERGGQFHNRDIFFGLAEKTNLISPSMNVLLITGFCGGFTTYSSMADDMYLLLQQRHWIYFGTYVGLTLLLGILMVYLGRSLIKAS